MATQTANLGLALPGYEDAADIAVLNQNAQKLDEQVLHWNMAPYPATATLTPSGALELSGVLPADKDGLTVQLAVEEGRIRFLSSGCPDKVCVRSGWLSRTGQTAACLPAGVVVRVQAADDAGSAVDMVAG